MTDIFWPIELPKTLNIEGLNSKRNSNVVRTTMDAGSKKVRRRYTASTKVFNGSMILDAKQLFILNQFYRFILADGVYRFYFTDPQSLDVAQFRFMEDYTEISVNGMFEVTMSLERLS